MHHLLFATIQNLQDFMDCMWCSKSELYTIEDVMQICCQQDFKKLTSTQNHAGLGQEQDDSG